MRRLSLLGLVCLLAACGGNGGGTTSTEAQTSASGCTTANLPSAAVRHEPKQFPPLVASKTYDVLMKTNCGNFTIRLDQKQSPHATASFVSLVEKKFFDRTIFHRIVPGFVIQGGDPSQTGEGGPGYTTVDRPPADASYMHGVVAMAKTASQPAGTAGSQFFIVTGADAGLPADYAIIGKVTDGLDVVDRIGKLGDQSEQPTQVVELKQATVSTS
jgi:peptidyl-prolyl cis-trans isomerase B (cyclophilin B)